MNKLNVDYKLYLVTDRTLLKGKDLYESIEKAILGGVTVIQLREKNIPTLDFYEEALKVREITYKYNVPLIINDRLDIALAVDADGLHIGQKDMPLKNARKLLGQDKIIGVSAASAELALAAERDGADYIGAGAVFATSTKDDAKLVSHSEVKKIKETLKIPVVAIGGINESNASIIMQTGIDGIAVVSAILCKEDTFTAANNIKEILLHF
jgi:thiamine-phosphate pyrophosphorylase